MIEKNPEVACYDEVSKQQGLENLIKLDLVPEEQTAGRTR